MPPRKRARASRAPSAELAPQPKSPTPTPAVLDTSPSKDEQLLADPWTDEEEIALFKGLMRWKPTGIHKHFHLLALHSWLLDHNHIHPRNPHTRPAGIWVKLNSMYDLSALDAREDARQLPPLPIAAFHHHHHSPSSRGSGKKRGRRKTTEPSPPADSGDDDDENDSDDEADSDADAYSEAANRIEAEEFTLPAEEEEGTGGFGEMMWMRRLPGSGEEGDEAGEDDAEEGASSPLLLPELNLAEEAPVAFTPSFAIEEEEETDDRPVKGRRGRKEKDKEKEKGKGESRKPSRRSARRAELVADEEEEKDEEGEEEEEGEDEDEGDEEEEESAAGTPVPRSTRGAAAESKRRSAAQARSTRRGRR